MLGLLDAILCWIKQIGCMVADALVAFLNLVVVGIIAVVQAIINAIPIDIPAAPSLPLPFTDALGWIAWVWPVGTTINILAFMVAAWVFWLGLSIALRWAHAFQAE